MIRILLVDDVAAVRMAIGMILARAGYSVESACDGNAALSLVVRRPPDAVLTDLWMPEMDGLGLIRALRAMFPAVAIIAMSGGSHRYSQESSLDYARRSGVTRLLMKPISKPDLLAAIVGALDAPPTAAAP
jgi:CheY-like chemotaxis protein